MTKPLPTAENAEKSVLCACLNAPDVTFNACDAHGVNAASFYFDRHEIIYSAAREIWERSRPIDFITLCQFLQDHGNLEKIGGAPFISSLFTFEVISANLTAHLEEVAEKDVRRRAYAVLMNHLAPLADGSIPVSQTLDACAGEIASLSTGRKVSDLEPIKEAVRRKLDRMVNGDPAQDIVPTGIDGLDRHSPMNLGDMPTISGEKKAGKSMLALTILCHVGLELNLPVGYLSLEDRVNSVVDRLFASVSRVPCWQHHAKFMTGLTQSNMNSAAIKLGQSKIYVRDDIHELPHVVSFIKRLKAKEPKLAAVVVDYAQLVKAREGRNDTREQEVSRISRTLRLLSLELRIVIILICQLNSDGDTRDSKAIEMDTTAMWKVCNGKAKGEKLIAVPFQRNGQSGIAFPITFMGEICRFENMAQTEVEDYEPEKPKKKST